MTGKEDFNVGVKSTYKLLNEQLADLAEGVDAGDYAIPNVVEDFLKDRASLVLVDRNDLEAARELAAHVETSAFIKMGEWLQNTAVKDAMKLAESSAVALSVPVTPVQAVEEVRRNIQSEIDSMRPKPNPLVRKPTAVPGVTQIKPGGYDRERGPAVIVEASEKLVQSPRPDYAKGMVPDTMTNRQLGGLSDEPVEPNRSNGPDEARSYGNCSEGQSPF